MGYVINDNDTILCSNITFDASHAFVTLKDGQTTMEVTQDKLKSFKMNGKIYERRILYNNYIPTEKTVYMELLGERNGLKLYVYKFNEGGSWNEKKAKFKGGYEIDQLMVYKENSLYLKVPNGSIKTVLDFFNMKGYGYN